VNIICIIHILTTNIIVELHIFYTEKSVADKRMTGDTFEKQKNTKRAALHTHHTAALPL